MKMWDRGLILKVARFQSAQSMNNACVSIGITINTELLSNKCMLLYY